MSRRPPRRRQQTTRPNAYAGPTTCLRCDKEFQSWDRRQNRLCERCRESIEAQPSEEPSHPMPKRKGRFRDAEEAP